MKSSLFALTSFAGIAVTPAFARCDPIPVAIKFAPNAQDWTFNGVGSEFSGVFAKGQTITVDASANNGSSKGPVTLSVDGPGHFSAMSNTDGDPLTITLPASGKYTFSLAECWAVGAKVTAHLYAGPAGVPASHTHPDGYVFPDGDVVGGTTPAPAGAALAGHLLLCVPDGKDGLYVRLDMTKSRIWAKFADGDEGGWEPFKKNNSTTIHFGTNGGFDFDTTGTGTLIFEGERTPCTAAEAPATEAPAATDLPDLTEADYPPVPADIKDFNGLYDFFKTAATNPDSKPSHDANCVDWGCEESWAITLKNKIVMAVEDKMTGKKMDGSTHHWLCIGRSEARRCYYDLGNVQDEMFAPKSKTWVMDKKLAEEWDKRPKTESAK